MNAGLADRSTSGATLRAGLDACLPLPVARSMEMPRREDGEREADAV